MLLKSQMNWYFSDESYLTSDVKTSTYIDLGKWCRTFNPSTQQRLCPLSCKIKVFWFIIGWKIWQNFKYFLLEQYLLVMFGVMVSVYIHYNILLTFSKFQVNLQRRILVLPSWERFVLWNLFLEYVSLGCKFSVIKIGIVKLLQIDINQSKSVEHFFKVLPFLELYFLFPSMLLSEQSDSLSVFLLLSIASLQYCSSLFCPNTYHPKRRH